MWGVLPCSCYGEAFSCPASSTGSWRFPVIHWSITSSCSSSTVFLSASRDFCFSFINMHCGTAWGLSTVPFLWVLLEYARSHLSFLALPWGLLAHSQYLNPRVIQIASVTGAWGLTFLVILVNVALAAQLLRFTGAVDSPLLPSAKVPTKRGAFVLMVVAGLLLALSLIHGHRMLNIPLSGKGVTLALIQGNIPQENKWDPQKASAVMETYSDLTRKAASNKPALIVWPETATPRAINLDAGIHSQVKTLAREAGAPILLGSSQQQKFARKDVKGLKHTNSAFLVEPTPKTPKLDRYDKIRLLPFGEYLPLKDIIPWSWIHVPEMAGYVPGDRITIFQVEGFRFATTICWENIFPDLVRRFVQTGAQFIINITNEAWFGETAAPYQFLAMSVFRAVENRVYVARCANTGVSCIIDPCGRIKARLQDGNGHDIFVQGVLTGSVVPADRLTFYTRHGDWLAVLCMVSSGVFLAMAFGARIRARRRGEHCSKEHP